MSAAEVRAIAAKGLAYRALASAVTGGVVLVFTGSRVLALGAFAAEFVLKWIGYCLYEWAWRRWVGR